MKWLATVTCLLIGLTTDVSGDEIETLVRDGRYQAAAELAEQIDPTVATADELLWKAIVLRATGNASAADEFFSQVAGDASGDNETRMTAMANLLRSGQEELLPTNHAELALTYIDQHENSELLEPAFNLLQEGNTLQRAIVQRQLQKWSKEAGTPTEEALPGNLAGLTIEGQSPRMIYSQRKSLADYYLGLAALAQDESETALFAFERFVERHPEHQLIVAATIRMAELRIQLGQTDSAEEILSAMRRERTRPAVIDQAEYLRARLLFAKGDYQAASEAFSERNRRDTALSAPFNAALAAIYADDDSRGEAYRNMLVSAPPLLSEESEKLVTELTLEKGLSLLSQNDPTAFEKLESFVSDHPEHPRAADAVLALAELYLNQVPAQAISAREQLEKASTLNLSLSQRELLDYIAIWVERAAGNDEAAISGATIFLDHWPHSPRRTEILMMLGEVYYRAAEFAKSTLYFESLAREAEESPLAEPSLFFAAKAAAQMLTDEGEERAVSLWNDVVAMGGPLAAHARHSQGLLALEQERLDDAIEAFEAVFELFPSRELRVAVLCDKGQAAYVKALAGEDSEEMLQTAIRSFEIVESDGTASRAWRFQAATRRGRCLEEMGQPEDALEAYYSVIESVFEVPISPELATNSVSRSSTSSRLEEADWLYRASFAAIQILQSRDQWSDALKIADFLSAAGGSRSIEAARYADQLRLKRFIWNTGEESR